WRGVQVDDFAIQLPDLSVDIQDFHLQANWRELLDRRLHVQDLVVGKVNVVMQSSDKPASDEPVEIPAIPVQVLLDRVALGQLDVTIDGQPLPVDVSNLETSLAVTGEAGQLVLRSLDVSHELADVSLSGELNLAELRRRWPVKANIDANVRGKGPDSPLCLPAFVPGSASAVQEQTALDAEATSADDNDESTPAEPVPSDLPPCAAELHLMADGS